MGPGFQLGRASANVRLRERKNGVLRVGAESVELCGYLRGNGPRTSFKSWITVVCAGYVRSAWGYHLPESRWSAPKDPSDVRVSSHARREGSTLGGFHLFPHPSPCCGTCGSQPPAAIGEHPRGSTRLETPPSRSQADEVLLLRLH